MTNNSEEAQQQHGRDEKNSNNNNSSSSSTTSVLLKNIDDTVRALGDDPFSTNCAASLEESSIKKVNPNDSIIRSFAPKGLEESFKQLYSILYPCLCRRQRPQLQVVNGQKNATISPNTSATTASAFVMGPRGCGKSLLVERCLSACQFAAPNAKYRKVHVNGIVSRGEDVPSIVYEITRQLSELAYQETVSSSFSAQQEPRQYDNERHEAQKQKDEQRQEKQSSPSPSKKSKTMTMKQLSKEKHLFRLRKSTFTSNLSLLESTFKIAEADEIPILLILDELDAFTNTTNEGEGDNDGGGSFGSTKRRGHAGQAALKKKQLLLYHLLDRVATPGSNLCLIGLTSSFAALTLLEKRIRSRAEGVSKVVYVKPPPTYPDLLQVLQTKIQNMCSLQKEIMNLLSNDTVSSSSNRNNNNNHGANKTEIEKNIVTTFERELKLGKDVRWFCRVLISALSLYRYDVVMGSMTIATESTAPPKFRAQHLMEALEMMQGCISDDYRASVTQHSSLLTVGGVAVKPRHQALFDLSKPEVAVVLSARRLLIRDSHNEEISIPLTLQRILQEYESFARRDGGGFVGGGGKGRTTKKGNIAGGLQSSISSATAIRLFERGVLVPSMDHSGGGPLQYHVLHYYKNLDPYSLSRMPLHMPIEIHRELSEALKNDLLECSTALKGWGKKY